jgi:hypothetical protein
LAPDPEHAQAVIVAEIVSFERWLVEHVRSEDPRGLVSFMQELAAREYHLARVAYELGDMRCLDFQGVAARDADSARRMLEPE